VSWALGYQIQVSQNTTFAGAPIYTLDSTALSTVIPPLENGRYYWHVRTLGSVAWSPTQSFVVNAP
jgi:hypothetical protein